MSDENIEVSTKERIGVYDAIETAKPGEPLFPIQGGDPLGPKTVEFWADEARKMARRLAEQGDEKRAKALLDKATSAEAVAWEMQAYQRGDLAVEEVRAQYNDAAAVDIRSWKAGLIAGTRHLREAAFHLTNAVEHLPAKMRAPLKRRIEQINKIASDYEPKRASYGNEPELPLE
jgi:hypothetical protein